MWGRKCWDIINYFIIVQTSFLTPEESVELNQTLRVALIEFMDSNEKTEKCEEEAAEPSKKEPGVEFLKGGSSGAAGVASSSHLLPSVHSPVTAPFFSSYKSVFQGWKNSVPKLYKYPPSDIEVVVYRKNGQVDKLKRAGSPTKFLDAKGMTNIAVPLDKVLQADVGEGNESCTTLKLECFEEAKAEIKPGQNILRKMSQELIGDVRPNVNDNPKSKDAPTLIEGLKQESLDSVSKALENNNKVLVTTEGASNVTCKDSMVSPPGLESFVGVDKTEIYRSQAPLPESCSDYYDTKLRSMSTHSTIMNPAVSKALIDVATQATTEFVKSIEQSVKTKAKNAACQCSPELCEVISTEAQTIPTAVDTKSTETDLENTKLVSDFACQMIPLTNSAENQTIAPHLVNTSSQTYHVCLSKETQTVPWMCLEDNATQTLVSQSTSATQTDLDILKALTKSQGCQAVVERESKEVQAVKKLEVTDFAMQCKPSQSSKAIQLPGICCRITEKRIKLQYAQYDAKLHKLLSLLQSSEKPSISNTHHKKEIIANGQAKTEPQDVEGAMASLPVNAVMPIEIREMIEVFRKRQKEFDELQEEMERSLEQLSEQISFSRSLDSHEYIEDDWFQQNSSSV